MHHTGCASRTTRGRLFPIYLLTGIKTPGDNRSVEVRLVDEHDRGDDGRHVNGAVVDQPVELEQCPRVLVRILCKGHGGFNGSCGKRGDLLPYFRRLLALCDKLDVDKVSVGTCDENLVRIRKTLGV